MKNWNKIGRIKAIIIAVAALPSVLIPTDIHTSAGFLTILSPGIFACIALILIVRFNALLGRKIVKPLWNDNPLKLEKPLDIFDFLSYFFMAIGLSMFVGTAIKYFAVSSMGLTALSFGFGIYLGIKLSLKWTLAQE